MGGARNGKGGRGGTPNGEQSGAGCCEMGSTGKGIWDALRGARRRGAQGKGCREVGCTREMGTTRESSGRGFRKMGCNKDTTTALGMQRGCGTGIWGAGSDWQPNQQQFQ